MTKTHGKAARQRSTEVPAGFVPPRVASAYAGLVGPVYEGEGQGVEGRRGFRVTDKHINRAGIVHGGMLMSFADMVMGRGVREAGPAGGVTVRMTTDFLGPAHHGDWVEGLARVTRTTRTLLYVAAEITANGRLILTASGIFRRLRRQHGTAAPTAAPDTAADR